MVKALECVMVEALECVMVRASESWLDQNPNSYQPLAGPIRSTVSHSRVSHIAHDILEGRSHCYTVFALSLCVLLRPMLDA